MKRCECCHKVLHKKRSDAKWCGGVCKQRMYRAGLKVSGFSVDRKASVTDKGAK